MNFYNRITREMKFSDSVVIACNKRKFAYFITYTISVRNELMCVQYITTYYKDIGARSK